MKEEEEGRWSRVNRGWRVLSRWLEKLRAAPHGNWQKCQQLAQLLATKFPKIVSIKNIFYFAVLGQQRCFGSTKLVWINNAILCLNCCFGPKTLFWANGAVLANNTVFGTTMLFLSQNAFFWAKKKPT